MTNNKAVYNLVVAGSKISRDEGGKLVDSTMYK